MEFIPVLSHAAKVSAQCQNIVQLDLDNAQQAAIKTLNHLESHSAQTWSKEPLHPNPNSSGFPDWIFFVSSLNFSFWSELDQDHRFGIQWRSSLHDPSSKPVVHTGYASLLAAIGRSRDEGLDITQPAVYAACTEETIRHVFRSARDEPIPLLSERLAILRENGQILLHQFGGSFENVLKAAGSSAVRLVHLIVQHFPTFKDEVTFNGQKVCIWKRAQICVAETWAAFEGQGLGRFTDIDQLTMFADYRVPQVLHSAGILCYSDHVKNLLESKVLLPYGSTEEDAVTLDFALWNLAKVEEFQSALLPHHRTRSIYY